MSFGELHFCLLVGVWSDSVLVEVALGSMQKAFYNVPKFMTSNTTSTNLSYENVQDRCEENIIKTL